MDASATPRIFGRDPELAQIDAFLVSASARFAVLSIEGVAGIGKTSLWMAGVADALERGYRVLSTRPGPTENQLSYAGLGDLAESVLDDVLDELSVPQREALEIALLRSSAGTGGPDHRTVSVAFLNLLRTIARSDPVVLAVDDIQWLDRASARVLAFAFRRLDGEPVVVLATRRLGEDPSLDPTEGLFPDRLRRLSVGPLADDTIRRVLLSHLETPVRRTILTRISRLSGGNPFFAVEMARALRWAGGSTPDDLTFPENLAAVVRGHLARLSDRDRQVMLAAAALSRPTVDTLEGTFREHGRVEGALLRATEAGVVEVEAGEIRFRHPLLASVMYADASIRDRRAIHRRLAVTVDDSEDRARHLALSADRPDPEVASVLDAAAVASLARGAPDAAAELWDMAIGLTEPDRPDEIRRRRLDRANALGRTDHRGARAVLEQVIADLPRGPERAGVLTTLGMVQAVDGWVEAASVFRQAQAEAGQDHVVLREIEQSLGFACLFSGDVAESEVHQKAGLIHAEMLAQPAPLAESLSALGFVEFVRGSGAWADHVQRALAIERRLKTWPRWAVLSPRFTFAQLLKYSGQLDEARDLFRVLLENARDRGDEGPVSVLHYHLSELESWAGNWRTAEEHADGAVEAAYLSDTPFYSSLALYARCLVSAQRGRLEDAFSSGQEGLRVATSTGVVLAKVLNLKALGFAHLSAGDHAHANEDLSRAVDGASTMGLVEPAYLRIAPDHIEALVELGDLDTAETALRSFEVRARRSDIPWVSATAARSRGLLEGARGNTDEAITVLSRAVDACEPLGQPFELARTLFVLGRVQRRSKAKRTARESLERSVSAFDSLGAELWAERARSELSRIGGRVPGGEALTLTERRVATLAAEGKTNREIADALFITVRTVEWNLSKVYSKLHVRSRGGLPRALVRGSGHTRDGDGAGSRS